MMLLLLLSIFPWSFFFEMKFFRVVTGFGMGRLGGGVKKGDLVDRTSLRSI